MFTMVITPANIKLIEAIKIEQSKRKLSSRKLCLLLGISPTYWHLIKTGKRGFGTEFLSGIVQVMPNLQTEVLSFLRENNNDGN